MARFLTKQQSAILKYLYQRIRREGSAPSVRDIADKFGFTSPSSAQSHLKALAEKDFLTLTGSHRGIQLNRRKCDRFFGIPVLSRISAGNPREGDSEIQYTLTPDDLFPWQENVIGVLVQGDSMKDAGILQGDICLIVKQDHAQAGEIVVAVNEEGQATVKRLAKRNGKLYLDPANVKYESVPMNGGRIWGKVIRVIRDV